MHVELLHGFPNGRRFLLHAETCEVIGDVVFLRQIVKRLVFALCGLLVAAFQEACREWHKHKDAHNDADDADGREGEETQRSVACIR